jgi:membrane fusion protein, heavy metal efflux system
MQHHRMAAVKLIPVAVVACFVLLAVVAAIFTVPGLRVMAGLEAKEAPPDEEGKKAKAGAARVLRDADGKPLNPPGVALTKAGINGLQIKPVPVKEAVTARPLPPQIGTINFDNETLFPIPSRFAGEIAEIMQMPDDAPDPNQPTAVKEKPKKRVLRYGDRVKQGDTLCVVHSVVLGTAKAALVDAVCSLALSKETLERHQELFKDGSIGLAQLKQSERQVQTDSNSLLTAERTLLTLKLTEDEVQEVKNEAKEIAKLAKDEKFQSKRNAKDEAEKWARVEIKVPWFDRSNPNRELTVVEKNTNLYSMVDPIATGTALFKLADLSRLQIWVHPAEEYLPTFRKMLGGKTPPLWTVVIPAYPDDKLPPMTFTQIAPSLEPYQHAPMLMGYLKNPDGNRYVVGQFVTATIDLPPEPNTVEVPTEAINEIGGEALVFVQPNPKKDEFVLHRVAIVQRFKDVTIVRTKLTKLEDDENAANASKREKGENAKKTIDTLQPGDLVITRGVVELTAALEDLLLKEEAK